MIKRLFLNDKFILGLIILNTIIIFVGGYVLMEQYRVALLWADNIVTGLFNLELVIKFKEFGTQKYFSSNWNVLDFVLIIVSLPALLIFLFNFQVFDVSFLLVFRILRILKAFRFIKFIPNVGQLIVGVKRAMKTSVFVLVGFVTYIFIVGILSFYLFKSSGSDYFENPMISLYSTFKIFTVEGWFEIPEQLTSEMSPSSSFFVYFYFIIIVLTGGIFGLSLVNSIFVEAMVSDNNDDLERKIDNIDVKITELLTKLKENET
jgi:voltage-gated sodium channel